MDINDAVVVDVETTGLRWSDRLLTVGLARKGESGIESLVLNLGYYQEANLFGITNASTDSRDIAIAPLQLPEAGRRFREFVGRRFLLIFHNGSFDIPYLLRAGLVTLDELTPFSVFDTMAMSRATGPHERVGLEYLCAEEDIGDDEWREMKGKRGHLESQPYDDLVRYSQADAIHTFELAGHMLPDAVALYGPLGCGGLLDEESEWVKMVAMLRYHGLGVDIDRLCAIESRVATDLQGTVSRLQKVGVKGPNDRTGILAWAKRENLLGHLNRTPSGNYSCDSESLGQVIDAAELIDGGEGIEEIAESIVEGRSLEKALETWLRGTRDRMGEDGRVHSLFTCGGTISNRLSCKEPNVQAYPEDYYVFAAREGYELWSLDWSQAELRIAAMLGRDEEFAKIFEDPDADPHMESAYLLFSQDAESDQRALAKRANFGSIYGAGVQAIMRATGCEESQARSLLASHRRIFKGLSKSSKQAESLWKSRGYLILVGGKRRYASQNDLNHSYKAFNQLIQGSVAEIIKRAMLRIGREVPHVLLVNQVHDSLEMEVRTGDGRSVEAARQIMLEAVPEEIRNLTDPPIEMKVDIKRLWPEGEV